MSTTHVFSKAYLLTLGLALGAQISAEQPLPTKVSDDAVIATYHGKDAAWKYLEYKFVVEPNKKINLLMAHASGIVGLAGATALGLKACTNYCPELSSKKLLENMVPTVSAVAVGYTALNYLQCYMTRTARKQVVVDLLDNWDTHRKYLPVSFVECFDELFVAYQEHGDAALTPSLICQVFTLVEHHLEHNFTNRYKKEDVKQETNLANFKSLTEVFKNLAP